MKRPRALQLIEQGGEKRSVLAAYLADRQETLQNLVADGKPCNGRNPTVAEFKKLGFNQCTIYAAASLAELEIVNGEIIVMPKRGLVHEK